MSEYLIPAEIEPKPNQANQAARVLQRLGFRVLHIGPTISVEGPEPLWSSTFHVTFVQQRKTTMPEIDGTEVTFAKALTEGMRVPSQLQALIARVAFAEPPEFY